jgi:hypothetical protein
MSTFDDVLGAAQDLPSVDRIRLVQALWETVPPAEWPTPAEEWIEEAASPWPDVRARARRKAGLDE